MTITDQDYQTYSDVVYWTDPNNKKKYDSSLKEGAITYNRYRIQNTKTQENSKTDGMQAMAVAPLDEKGNIDTSQIVISYAGTNTSDIKDIENE
ncbi:hypothetical protein [Enterococcus mundtii]|uniref:hypothetical protein n=1 Tax=Enterococcus mundtii TaxID=53346 RepID=UPI0035C670D8